MGKDVLIGWKEISEYLNISIRQCQRYEKKYGLPAYRLGSQVRIDIADFKKWYKKYKFLTATWAIKKPKKIRKK